MRIVLGIWNAWIINLMLVRAEVSRRAETLNSYVLNLKDKVKKHKYREAKQLILESKESINNNYMAPYDPNVYLLDSLKTKTEKLQHDRQALQARIDELGEQIEAMQLKKGIQKGRNDNMMKSHIAKVDIYASRLTLTLKDAEKVDYEQVSVETDFVSLHIIMGAKNLMVPYSCISLFETAETEILLSWRHPTTHLENYMIMRFELEEEMQKWAKTIKFCKLLSDSKLKKKHFMKNVTPPPEPAPNQNDSGLRHNPRFRKDSVAMDDMHAIEVENNQRRRKTSAFLSSSKPSSNIVSIAPALTNNPSYDRLRRQSMYSPFVKKPANEAMFLTGKRKVSEDITADKFNFNRSNYFNEKKLNKYTSEKSLSLSNSQNNDKEEEPKIAEISIPPNLHEERSNGLKLKQIFQNNESSIHWIEEEREDERLEDDSNRDRKSFVESRTLNVFESDDHESEHISEQEVAEGDESPTIPYNMRRGKSNTITMKDEVDIGKTESEEQPANKDEQIGEDEDGEEGEGEEEEMGVREEKMPSISLMGFKADENDNELNEDNYEDNERDHPSSGDQSEHMTDQYQLEELAKGIEILKCAENGWNPHMKRLYLSVNHTDLCWQESKDIKSVPLNTVEAISYSHNGKGILKHIKKIDSQRCLIIRTRNGDDLKLLEFYLPEKYPVSKLSEFAAKLINYWENCYKKPS